jgi:hypothetical protein
VLCEFKRNSLKHEAYKRLIIKNINVGRKYELDCLISFIFIEWTIVQSVVGRDHYILFPSRPKFMVLCRKIEEGLPFFLSYIITPHSIAGSVLMDNTLSSSSPILTNGQGRGVRKPDYITSIATQQP